MRCRFLQKNTFSTCFVSPEKKLKSISTFKAPKIDFLWRVVNFPGLGFTLAEPQTGIIVKSWFGVLSQSFPSSGWRKQSFWEGKRQKIELKLFLLGHDQYKRYILQKTGSKTAICVLRTGLSNLNPLMWGSHGQLDDRPTKTQMTIGDHLVGWATRFPWPTRWLTYKDPNDNWRSSGWLGN